jgi:hypothetical protein
MSIRYEDRVETITHRDERAIVCDGGCGVEVLIQPGASGISTPGLDGWVRYLKKGKFSDTDDYCPACLETLKGLNKARQSGSKTP